MKLSLWSIGTRLMAPLALQLMTLSLLGYFYLSSNIAMQNDRERTEKIRSFLQELQSIDSTIQAFIEGQGDPEPISQALQRQVIQLERSDDENCRCSLNR